MKETISIRTLFGIVSLAALLISGCEKSEQVAEQVKKEHEKAKEKATNDHGHSHGHGDGHSHDHGDGDGHDHTPHMGMVVPIWTGSSKAGFAELKLHDDKGDLEFWLTEDESGTKPYDLPTNAVITVTFPELDKKTVTLQVRDTEKNEDEDGKGNIRASKTNYFIFPGDTGVDASFLVGKEFASKVVISFSDADTRYVTDEFELKPHTH